MGSTHQLEDKTYEIHRNWFAAKAIYFLHAKCMSGINCTYSNMFYLYRNYEKKPILSSVTLLVYVKDLLG